VYSLRVAFLSAQKEGKDDRANGKGGGSKVEGIEDSQIELMERSAVRTKGKLYCGGLLEKRSRISGGP